MSNRDNRDTSGRLVSDETATRDVGGAFGGSAGTMESREGHEAYEDQAGMTVVQNRTDMLSHPGPETQGGPSEPLTYAPDAGTGSRSAPMASPDARDVTTANTDVRRDSQDADQNLGEHYPGDNAPDRAAGDDLPGRSNPDQTDAF